MSAGDEPRRPDPEAPTEEEGVSPVEPAREEAGPAEVAEGAPPDATTEGPPPETAAERPTRAALRSRTGGLWVVSILSAVFLLVLLIFIMQNLASVKISFFALEGQLPLGVALLLAAVCGVLIVAIPGTGRIIQLRRVARRQRMHENAVSRRVD
ncbi:MAG: lipopolysaccharide assembly protein LapA domain-containing protein [Streptomycetales bacterium]